MSPTETERCATPYGLSTVSVSQLSQLQISPTSPLPSPLAPDVQFTARFSLFCVCGAHALRTMVRAHVGAPTRVPSLHLGRPKCQICGDALCMAPVGDGALTLDPKLTRARIVVPEKPVEDVASLEVVVTAAAADAQIFLVLLCRRRVLSGRALLGLLLGLFILRLALRLALRLDALQERRRCNSCGSSPRIHTAAASLCLRL